MTDRYQPPSDFLQAIIAEEVPLSGGAFADDNLRRLIAMMSDPDRANRDWATFLLAQEAADTPAIREALLRRAQEDEYDVVRAEAVLGLAKRDPMLALPFVQRALQGEAVAIPIFEAAELCAHPSLVPDLRVWAEPSDNEFADMVAANALVACERGVPLER